ncbi:MAG: hypothetical protein QHJ81_05870 [Anaerolineae bacterium]|nr:hypothetical protein [Anaerolineae bacterium]
MNAFNRIVTVLLLFVLLLLCIILAVSPAATLDLLGRSMELWSEGLAQWGAANRLLYPLLRIVAVILAALVFGFLLFLELRPRRPGTVRLLTAEGSTAAITTDAVSQRLIYHIARLADVVAVTPHVTSRGRLVDVVLDLETRPEIDVPMKTDEVVAVAREVIEERMGLQLGKTNVRIRHAPYVEE